MSRDNDVSTQRQFDLIDWTPPVVKFYDSPAEFSMLSHNEQNNYI
jgi:hypothetical protein